MGKIVYDTAMAEMPSKCVECEAYGHCRVADANFITPSDCPLREEATGKEAEYAVSMYIRAGCLCYACFVQHGDEKRLDEGLKAAEEGLMAKLGVRGN